ncbi:protein of unknown function [Rhizobium sp. RU20A]|uniref:DUF4424 domain-containing protein n=1 Tax=Rhizobium sp. RU20A TaxID=1907412 RepID=UPI000954A372|nr:DUF4424 domain-containing protein [Rhizobium sp. RU20A]SIR09298.1 protein of unknown function [Rhizobium sp. RU20A]
MTLTMKRTAIAAALGLLLASTSARANDTLAELHTGGLVFMRSDAVEMAKEDLFISPTEIRVEYVFRNATDADVDSIVAFPMPDIQGSMEGDFNVDTLHADNFLGFSTTQDGAPIKPELQQRATVFGIDVTADLKAEGIPLMPYGEATAGALTKLSPEKTADWVSRGIVMKNEWDDGSGVLKSELVPIWKLSSVYYWRTRFPAGKTVSVKHTYTPSVGGTAGISFLDEGKPTPDATAEYRRKYCMDEAFIKRGADLFANAGKDNQPYYTEAWISYILTTGSNWYGPIKDFTLTVDKGDPKNFVSFCGENVRKIGETTFQIKATDFYPQEELSVLILQYNDPIE